MTNKKKNKIAKICFRCGKLIDEVSNYYSFTEFNETLIISVDYAHRSCWDEFLLRIGNAEKLKKIAEVLHNKLTGMGIEVDM